MLAHTDASSDTSAPAMLTIESGVKKVSTEGFQISIKVGLPEINDQVLLGADSFLQVTISKGNAHSDLKIKLKDLAGQVMIFLTTNQETMVLSCEKK